jgi:hypothetical protein
VTSIRFVSRLALAAACLAIGLAGAPLTVAHEHIAVGDFHIVVGWGNEPALAGEPNSVDVFVSDHDEKPIVDLAADALSVVVSTGGQDSQPLVLTPAFDVEEGFGTPGQYSTDLIPTAPGDYIFHFTGSIHDQAVDVSVTSGEETFSPVQGASDLEFPVKQPTLTEVGTRLDRIDGRIDALQSAVPGSDVGGLAAAGAAMTAAQEASSAADRALLIGLVLGGAGLVVALAALLLVVRSRRAAGPA